MAIGNAFRAPTVSGLNSAGWWLNDRKMHAGRRMVFLAKSEKNAKFWQKYGEFGFLARFLDDVSMTSSGGGQGRMTSA